MTFFAVFRVSSFSFFDSSLVLAGTRLWHVSRGTTRRQEGWRPSTTKGIIFSRYNGQLYQLIDDNVPGSDACLAHCCLDVLHFTVLGTKWTHAFFRIVCRHHMYVTFVLRAPIYSGCRRTDCLQNPAVRSPEKCPTAHSTPVQNLGANLEAFHSSP